MRPSWCFLLSLTLLASVDVVRAQSPKPGEPPKTFDIKAIDAYVAAQVREQGYPGLSLTILREGKIVLAKGYGKRSLGDGPPVEPDTAFAVGSVTKQFTCACVLLLAEEGKLSVEDTVAKYDSKLARAGQVTLHDLMSHTSGYPDFYPLDFVDRRLRQPIQGDDLLATYAASHLDFEPGTRWSYSNTGYTLLGRVVEKASGKPLGRYLEERILGPLGMTHSAFEPGSDWKGPTIGYTSFGLGPAEPAEPESRGWLGAAGGLWASGPDLARWDLALMEGRVLKPGSFRVMVSPKSLASGIPTDYGCGLHIQHVGGETVLTHGGAVSGFLSINAMVPRTRSAVILLTNSEHLNPGSMHQTILHLLLQDLGKPGVPIVQGPSPKAAALEFLHEMQAGRVNRDQLGEEFSVFLTEERLKAAAPRLKALGEPEKVEVEGVSERGGMEVASIRFQFKTTELRGLLYRSPDGKIQQLLFRKG